MEYQLLYPILHNGKQLHTIHLRRLILDDFLAAEKQFPAARGPSEIQGTALLLQRLSGLPAKTIVALDLTDFFALSALIGDPAAANRIAAAAQ